MEIQGSKSDQAITLKHREWMQKNMSEQLRNMMTLQDNIIMIMVNLIETRDGTAGGHAKRACEYISYLLKKALYTHTYADNLTYESMQLIIKAAPLYDIGKIGISDTILKKPGRLSAEEFELIKTHTIIGSELIQKNLSGIADNTFLHMAANMAACHHERWDGKGYPAQLEGLAIPLCARFAAIADVFDALVSKTYYNSERSFQEAVRIMEESKGQFDPVLLKLFLEDKDELRHIMEMNLKNESRYLLQEDGLLNCGNHEAFYHFLQKLYLDELEEKRTVLARAMDERDYETIVIHAHSLKSSSWDVGAQSLSTLAECLVFAAQDKNEYSLEKYRRRFDSCLEGTIADVKNYLSFERVNA